MDERVKEQEGNRDGHCAAVRIHMPLKFSKRDEKTHHLRAGCHLTPIRHLTIECVQEEDGTEHMLLANLHRKSIHWESKRL